jgi:hypothetical protein
MDTKVTEDCSKGQNSPCESIDASPLKVYNSSGVEGGFGLGQRSNQMSKTSTLALALACALFIAMRSVPAFAQAGGNGNQPQQMAFTPEQLQSEVSGLAHDLDDPNYDYSKVPDRMRQIFQDFRSVTQDMDPDRAQAFRQQMFQQIMPVMQRNMAKIQAAMQFSFVNNLQEPMGCSDDEFQALKPSLLKVVQAAQADQMANFRGFGGGGQGQGQQNLTPLQQATQDLQTALDDASSTPDSISSKVDAVRLAKDKADQDLKAAREELRQLLTIRQEAVLVTQGLLD